MRIGHHAAKGPKRPPNLLPPHLRATAVIDKSLKRCVVCCSLRYPPVLLARPTHRCWRQLCAARDPSLPLPFTFSPILATIRPRLVRCPLRVRRLHVPAVGCVLHCGEYKASVRGGSSLGSTSKQRRLKFHPTSDLQYLVHVCHHHPVYPAAHLSAAAADFEQRREGDNVSKREGEHDIKRRDGGC